MQKDISEFEDVKLLVDKFYAKVLKDDTIGYIFNEVLTINWNHHFPIMYSFWQSVLLGVGGYKGNPVRVHIELNDKEPLTETHFNRWMELWEATIDENFIGNKAEEAKAKAQAMKTLMLYKIQASQNPNFIQ